MTELLSKQNLTLKRIAYKEKKILQEIQLEFSDGLVSPIFSRHDEDIGGFTDRAEANFKGLKYFDIDQN